MLKVIKVEFFDQYSCWMSECPENCCNENWRIIIDEKTYSLYKEMGIPNVDSFISDTSPRYLIKKDGKCPFITENGLCRLHRDYGEDYISDTCRFYPRFVSVYGDVYVENLGLSCPAVGSLMMDLDRKCRILSEVFYEDESELGQKMENTEDEQRMWDVLDIFYGNDDILEAYRQALAIFGSDREVSLASDFIDKYSLQLFNISIIVIFENIMLETKKESPDFAKVIEKGWDIILDLCSMIAQKSPEFDVSKDDFIDGLRGVMRARDHG